MSTAYEGTQDPRARSATGASADQPVEDQSLGSIVSRISDDFSQLVRQEITLAKLELKEEGKKAGKAAGLFGGAAFAGWMTALFASVTLMWALNHAMDVTWAAFIVTVVWLAAAAAMAFAGRQQAREINPAPQQTIDTLKEDAEWLKAQKK